MSIPITSWLKTQKKKISIINWKLELSLEYSDLGAQFPPTKNITFLLQHEHTNE